MSGSFEVGPYHGLIAMIATWQRSNGVTTATGERRIRQFIESRKIDLEAVTKRIEEEEAQIISCDNAIYNLEMAIPDGRNMLKAHDESLSTLKTLRERISDISSRLSWETKPEANSEALCAELKECFLMPAANGEIIQEQIELITTEVRKLCDKICQLEMDLEMWKFSRNLSQSALDHLKSTRDTIGEDIALARTAFRALWKIPTHIWVAIFDCVRREEMDDYLKRRDYEALRPVVHVLYHVCYSWRRIIDAEPLLWTTVYAPPTRAWKYYEYHILVSSARKANRSLTLLINVFQTLRTGPLPPDDPYRRFDKDGSIAQTLVPDETAIFRGVPYVLHVKMDYDTNTSVQRMSQVPFREASSLILQYELDIRTGYILSRVSFQAVKSLTIIGALATYLPSINIVETMPQITSLYISIRQLPANMTLAGYLPPALEELLIHHEDRATFPSPPTGIQLPKLEKLGVTYGSMGLLEATSMPSLRTLILYGSRVTSQVHQIHQNDNADQNYRRVMELRFREWGVVDAGSTNSGAVSLLQTLAPKMSALQAIKFADSFIAGEFLITVVDNAMNSSGGGGLLRALKEVTLSKVAGITRSQCDTVANLVPKLNIYV